MGLILPGGAQSENVELQEQLFSGRLSKQVSSERILSPALRHFRYTSKSTLPTQEPAIEVYCSLTSEPNFSFQYALTIGIQSNIRKRHDWQLLYTD